MFYNSFMPFALSTYQMRVSQFYLDNMLILILYFIYLFIYFIFFEGCKY